MSVSGAPAAPGASRAPRFLRGLGGNVITLGAVSLLTDIASEMIYPLLPLFLTSVLAAGPATLGAIEGLAESTAALVKLGAGLRSDRTRRRKPAHRLRLRPGRTGAARWWRWPRRPACVAAIRFTDRVGKGLRGAPRDALIADSVDPALRGRAFGLQRSMDHAGALIGPLVAAALLAERALRIAHGVRAGSRARAAGRGAAGVAGAGAGACRRESSRQWVAALGALPRGPLRRYLVILLLFTLGNSSDAFLLLRAGELGVAPAHLPLLWAFFHLVKAGRRAAAGRTVGPHGPPPADHRRLGRVRARLPGLRARPAPPGTCGPCSPPTACTTR